MTDKEKLDAIRAEIHRLVDVRGYDKEMANDLFAFMDSLPNEPVSEEWIEELRTKLDSMSKEDFKKVFDKYAVDFNKEPVNEDLLDEIHNRWEDDPHTKWPKCPYKDFKNIACHFANWQKQEMMKDAVDGAYIRRNRYTHKNVLNGFDVTCDAIQKFKDGDKLN